MVDYLSQTISCYYCLYPLIWFYKDTSKCRNETICGQRGTCEDIPDDYLCSWREGYSGVYPNCTSMLYGKLLFEKYLFIIYLKILTNVQAMPTAAPMDTVLILKVHLVVLATLATVEMDLIVLVCSSLI